MNKEEIAELIEQMPQGMDANDYIHELVNRALAVEREWVGLTDKERADWHSMGLVGVEIVAAHLKEKNYG